MEKTVYAVWNHEVSNGVSYTVTCILLGNLILTMELDSVSTREIQICHSFLYMPVTLLGMWNFKALRDLRHVLRDHSVPKRVEESVLN